MDFPRGLLTLAFVCIAALGFYLVANEKSQQKPYVLFGAAIFAILGGYLFNAASNYMGDNVKNIRSRSEDLVRDAEKLESKALQPSASLWSFEYWNNTPSKQNNEWNLAQAKRKRAEALASANLANELEKANVPLKTIADLMMIVSGVFAGALASVAITNRAKFRYDKRALHYFQAVYLEYESMARDLQRSIEEVMSKGCAGTVEHTKFESRVRELKKLSYEIEAISSYLNNKELEGMEIPLKN